VTLFRFLALASLLAASACSRREEGAKPEGAKPGSAVPSVQSSPKPATTDSAAFALHIGGVAIVPGIWVADARFAAQDTSEPVVLGESVTDAGIRIRFWLHQGTGFAWVSTNQGMTSPDGPYWVSQVESDRPGAAFDSAFRVGSAFPAAAGDTDLVSRQGDLERTVSVRGGKIAKLILAALAAPRP
jgi:hypothetical protein